jgi:cellulase/cellobiase CelA1
METGGIRRHRMAAGSTRILGRLSPRTAVVAGVAVAAVALLVVQLVSTLGGRASPTAAPDGAQPTGSGSPAPEPSPTAQMAATPSPRVSAVRRGITATYAVTRSWDDGFVERITLTNHDGTPADWTVTLVLPAGTSVTKVWRADVRRSGSTFEFTSPDRLGPLAPGATVWFGFEADGTAAAHQSCEVNGRPCG